VKEGLSFKVLKFLNKKSTKKENKKWKIQNIRIIPIFTPLTIALEKVRSHYSPAHTPV
jgi:hypothetical protein